MIEYSEAISVLNKFAPNATKVEQVSLNQSVGRVLGQDVIADVNLPPFNKSGMDGFAVVASDLKNLPVTLNIVMDIPAGAIVKGNISSGQAAAIMTGAPVPDGADAVVQVEWTSGFGKKTVIINNGVKSGRNVSPKGEIVKEGQVVLTAGHVISVEEVGLMAAVGCDFVSVYAQPKVAVLSTGDEVVGISEKPGLSQIRDVNGPALLAFVKSLGLEAVWLGCVKDAPESLLKAIEKGLKYDCLLLSGGVSAGAYDFVEDVLAKLKIKTHFRRLAVKPGKPTVFGTKDDKIIFGLPGNPVSAMVIARLFVELALKKRMGYKNYEPTIIRAKLCEDINKKPNRLWFVHGFLQFGNEISVAPLKNKGSADLLIATKGNCLLIGPKGVNFIAKGSFVDVVIWEKSL